MNLYRVFNKGVGGTRTLYPASKIWDIANEKVAENQNADFYESIYLYSDKHVEILKETKSLAGIRDVVINRIVLDFDYDKKDQKFSVDERIEMARLDTIYSVKLLYKYFKPEEVQIYHSGGKGFHLVVETDKYMNRQEFEAHINYFGESLKTFDTKIKDQQRLFRFPMTKNLGTGRYKIPLTFEELNTDIENIKKLSANPDFDLRFGMLEAYKTAKYPQELSKVISAPKEEKKETNEVVADRPNMANRPKHLTPAKYALQEGFFEEGERNEACMILATTYKYLGYNQETTYNIIKATLRMRSERLGLGEYDKAELWNTIIKPVYSPTWKGGTYSEEEGLLKRTIDRYRLDKVGIAEAGLVGLTSLASNFRNFATNIDANTIKTGIDELDKKVRLTTGMLVAFLAAPGAGKTSVAFGILNTLSNNNEKGMFFSMDMGPDQVFQRIIQRHTGHDSDRIFKNYQNNVVGETTNYEELLEKNYKNIKFCFKTSLTPETIREAIVKEIQLTGIPPKMILLDYLECIQTSVSDPTQSKALAALALKDMATEFGINVFLLTQPTKLVGGPAGELTSYTQIKGSGVVGEQATVVLTMSRPGFDPKNVDDDNYVTINCVKNRMGPLSSTDLHWKGLTGQIRSLSHEEENDLKALRAAIAQEKNNKDDDLY